LDDEASIATQEAGVRAGCLEQKLSIANISASSVESAALPPALAVDGNMSTRWSSAYSDPQWIMADLGASRAVSRVVLRWETAASKSYDLQVSDDGSTWRTVFTTDTGDGGVDDIRNLDTTARYVRLYSRSRTTRWGVSLWELEVYGDPNAQCGAPTTCTEGALARSSATASTTENAQLPPQQAIDGNLNTRWSSSYADPQWLSVDLGARRFISKVELVWEVAASKNYDLQVSDDGSTWRTVFTEPNGNGGTDVIASLNTAARYVRLYSRSRTTRWGVSLWEFRVFGDANPSCTPPTNTPADLVEGDILSRWSAASEDVATHQRSVLGAADAYAGQAALRVNTTSGFDFWVRYDAPAPIDASQAEVLNLAVRALNTTPYSWQINGPVIELQDASGARLELTPDSQYLPKDGRTWVRVQAPLRGGDGWTASPGPFDYSRITAIEVHADTWDTGFTLDVDDVRFGRRFEACAGAPASLSAAAAARATTSTVTWSTVPGALGYNVYRAAGSAPLALIGRARSARFEDSGLNAGTAYRYEVRPVLTGECESGAATTQVTTRGSASGLLRVPTLSVLAPMYLGTSPRYSSAEVASMKSGLELARQFYYRATRGRLNLALDYLEIDAATPDTSGPTMDNIARDLKARGVADNQYDAVYGIGHELAGCYGGFQILGKTAGAFGTVCGVDYPLNDPNVNTTMTWNFTHEFQHAFDFVIANGSGQDMIHAHPDAVYGDAAYSGPVVDAGEHFDWIHATLRGFTAYDTLAAPWSGYLETEDADADGLPDADARLPMDEQRFGSRADAADTDNDGLSDLGEYSAGRFASSNPTNPDTDADGQRDGVDPSPRAGIAREIYAATPALDGVREASYTRFRAGVEYSAVPGFTASTYFAYDANYLYVFAETSQPASLLLQVDGSGGNGFWHGDNTYSFSLSPNQSSVLNHTSRHGTSEPGRNTSGSTLITRTSGSQTLLEARIPRANLGQGFGYTGGTTSGFSTSAGSVLGLRVYFTQIGGAGDLFQAQQATQNEHWHFDDVTLR
jgi:hypothetical protein